MNRKQYLDEMRKNYSALLQQEAQREKQEVIDNILAAAAVARKEIAERQAVEDARIAELRKQNEIDAEKRLTDEIRAHYAYIPQADFERMLPRLRDEYLLKRSKAIFERQRQAYAEFI